MQVNEALDALSAHLDLNRDLPKSNTLKRLGGNPTPPATHELYLWSDGAAKVPPETSHALVQGEFTLTVELVRRLQSRGITCLAATSKRDVEEGSAGRRVATFTFVRFRAYPEPQMA
ncbi:MAG: hypothetical protein IRY89_16465 [Pseudolabrys sp.]|nr:hypothetical protein [Pseudolabrys sp.]